MVGLLSPSEDGDYMWIQKTDWNKSDTDRGHAHSADMPLVWRAERQYSTRHILAF